jgi:hypothetical protein
MAAAAMETAKMQKKLKNTKMIIAGYLQSYMKFDERNPNFFLILPFLFP